MSGFSGKVFTLGAGKQTAKGTPQTTPAFKVGLVGGNVESKRGLAQLGETDVSAQHGESVVVSERVEGDPEIYARPDDAGFWAFLLMGADAVTGAGPYVHTLTMALNAPYATLYRALHSTVLVDRFEDCRVGRATFRGQAGGILSIQLGIQGGKTTYGQTDPVLAKETAVPFVYPQVTVTRGGSAPGTVESFDMTYDWGQDFFQADKQYEPQDVIRKVLSITGTMTILFESDADHRKFHTGASGGTTTSGSLFTESMVIHAEKDAATYIEHNMALVEYQEYSVGPNAAGDAIRVVMPFRAKPNFATPASYGKIVVGNTKPSY
jgi:hypothetical protein